MTQAAGQERYKSVTRQYYNGADGAVVVYVSLIGDTKLSRYGVDDRNSFTSVQKWMDEVQDVNSDAQFLLVGNKSDLQRDRKGVTKVYSI